MKKVSINFSTAHILVTGAIIFLFTGCGPAISTLAGSGVYGYQDGSGDQAQFDRVKALAVDSKGNVYLSDFNNGKPVDRRGYNHFLRKITSTGLVSTLAGGDKGFADGAVESARFNGITGMVFDLQGNLLIADFYNHRIRKITPEGVVTTLAGADKFGHQDGFVTSATLNNPTGVAVAPDGSILFLDYNSNKVRKLSM